jgi:hypothetical protein
MALRLRERWNDRDEAERLGGALLLAAGVVVGFAILADDELARRLNGVSGLLWFSAAALLIRAARGDRHFVRSLAGVVGVGSILALFVRPSDLWWAVAGFGVAGALVALATGARGELWAKVLPALWLPLHLTIAIVRAATRAMSDEPAALRRDPPPTTALVPFAMIVAAWAGGLAVVWWRERRDGAKSSGSSVDAPAD